MTGKKKKLSHEYGSKAVLGCLIINVTETVLYSTDQTYVKNVALKAK